MSIGSLLFVAVAFMAFVIFAVVAVFVGMAARRLMLKSKVDITDGLDANELRILQEHFAKRKAASEEAALKAKLADITKV